MISDFRHSTVMVLESFDGRMFAGISASTLECNTDVKSLWVEKIHHIILL